MIKEKDTIIKLISALYPKVKIYLFGSRARGKYKPSSDIDLALDFGTPISSLELAKIENIIEALNIPQKVDIVDFQNVSTELKNIILKESIIWKS